MLHVVDGNAQFEHLREADTASHDQAGPRFSDIASGAVEDRSLLIENNLARLECSLTALCSALIHREFPRPNSSNIFAMATDKLTQKRPGDDAPGPPWETTSSRELLAVKILISELFERSAGSVRSRSFAKADCRRIVCLSSGGKNQCAARHSFSPEYSHH